MKRLRITVFLILFLLIMIFPAYRVSAASTTLAVDPQISTANVGSTFSVNVNVTNVVNFTDWQLDLYYPNSVLNCSSAIEGPFLKTGGSTVFVQHITNNYNSTYGDLLAYCYILGPNWVNGGGTILTVTFTVLGGNNVNLTLANTILGDNEIPRREIPHVDINGRVIITGQYPDIALTNLTSYKTCIGRGTLSNVSATVENLGNYTETFNTTVSAGQTIIVTFTNTTLTSGSSSTLTFSWNTTGFAYGNYTLSAYAWPVPGETNTANNNFTGVTILIAIPGDINGDFKVNLADLVLLANAYGTNAGSVPRGYHQWNPNADIDGNGVVGLSDLVILATHYGQHYP